MLKLQYFLGMYRQDFLAVPSGKNSESGYNYAGRELPAMSRRHDFLLPRGRKYLHWSFANAVTFGLWGDLEEALELLHKMRDAAQLYVQQSGVTRSWSKNVGFFVHCCPSQKDIPGPCALHIIDLDVATRERNDPKPGLASPTCTAKLLWVVLGYIAADFGTQTFLLQYF